MPLSIISPTQERSLPSMAKLFASEMAGRVRDVRLCKGSSEVRRNILARAFLE